MIKVIAIAFAVLGSVPAYSQTSVTIEQLAKDSLGDASPASLVGKTVTVNPVRFGEVGFVVAQPKDNYLSFVCESGDKPLTSKKPKATPFQGITTKAQGYEGITVWYLKDCRVASVK